LPVTGSDRGWESLGKYDVRQTVSKEDGLVDSGVPGGLRLPSSDRRLVDGRRVEQQGNPLLLLLVEQPGIGADQRLAVLRMMRMMGMMGMGMLLLMVGGGVGHRVQGRHPKVAQGIGAGAENLMEAGMELNAIGRKAAFDARIPLCQPKK
jgi:hypothetical protein